MRALFFIVLVASAAACNRDNPQCETYVDLAMKCDSDLKDAPSEERKLAKSMLGAMCREAFRNDTSKVEGETKQMVREMYAELRTRASCAAEANSCAAYDKCGD